MQGPPTGYLVHSSVPELERPLRVAASAERRAARGSQSAPDSERSDASSPRGDDLWAASLGGILDGVISPRRGEISFLTSVREAQRGRPVHPICGLPAELQFVSKAFVMVAEKTPRAFLALVCRVFGAYEFFQLPANYNALPTYRTKLECPYWLYFDRVSRQDPGYPGNWVISQEGIGGLPLVQFLDPINGWTPEGIWNCMCYDPKDPLRDPINDPGMRGQIRFNRLSWAPETMFDPRLPEQRDVHPWPPRTKPPTAIRRPIRVV